jgi:uncharacterized protein
MRLDNEKPSDNVEDRRGQGGGGGGFGFPGGFPGGGRQINIPMGGRGGGFSFSTIVMIAIAALAYWFFTGRNPISDFTGGGGGIPMPQNPAEYQIPDKSTDVAVAPDAQPSGKVPAGQADADPGKKFVSLVLGSTDRVWSSIFEQHLGKTYKKPPLVMFSGYIQSGCGMAQSQMGPFYCPRDGKVYIDLSFYNDMKNKLGAPGDFAQAYVIAHEVGHHVQDLLGIADKVMEARTQRDEASANALQVRMELQADCLAGVWAQEADASAKILEDGDIEEALNAAQAIGDDRLQKRSQGYVVPESFTHGSSAQRVAWFKRGMGAKSLADCDTFAAEEL